MTTEMKKVSNETIKKMLTFPNFQSSKQEEVAFLDKLHDNVDPQSYVGQLFTTDMIRDLSQRIRNDFSCDIFEDMQTETRKAIFEQNRATNLEAQVENARIALESKDETIASMKHQHELEVNRLRELNNDLLVKVEENTTSLQTMLKQVETLEADVETLEAENGTLEFIVKELKSDLYDWEHGIKFIA